MGLFEKAMEAFTPKAPESTALVIGPDPEWAAKRAGTMKLIEEAKRMATRYTPSFKSELENLCAHLVPKSSGYKWDVSYSVARNMYEVRVINITHGCGWLDVFSEADGVYSAERQMRSLVTSLVDKVAMAVPAPSFGPFGPTTYGAVAATPTMALTDEEITRVRRMLAAFEGAVKEKESDGSS